MRKLICFFLFFVLFFLIFPKKSFAATDKFETFYNVTYKVLETGITNAKFDVSLKNKEDLYYASSYKVRLGFDNIENFKVFDPSGPLQTYIKNDEEGQEIELVFNQRVSGKGNSLPFSISFQTNEIAHKQGSIWEINIPGILNQNEFSSFNVALEVPPSFGEPIYIKPQLESKSLKFTKEQLGKSGISIAFGSKQNYKFTLNYHLFNKNVFPVKEEIAIPPSTNYQDVYIENIFPPPLNVVKDNDGNWLAQYILSPKQKIDIVVKGKSELYLYPKRTILSSNLENQYLKEDKYWNLTPEIKKLGEELKTPQNIYNFVVKTLNYDFSRVTLKKPRLTASESLKNPQSAVCLEFTDLFITIARSAGIPSREIDGFAYTKNPKERPLSLEKDILHAWPEYYDRNLGAWIMVDPTWGNTTKGVDYFNTLDFDHFAFAIRGSESIYPIPAGGYKLQSNNSRDVYVEFSDPPLNIEPKIKISLDVSDNILSFLPIKGYVIINNIGTSEFPSQILTVEADGLIPKSQKTFIAGIPPYGYIKIPLTFKSSDFLTNKKATVKINIAGKIQEYSLQISPLPFIDWRVFIGGAILSVIIILFITRRAWNIFLFKQKE